MAHLTAYAASCTDDDIRQQVRICLMKIKNGDALTESTLQASDYDSIIEDDENAASYNVFLKYVALSLMNYKERRASKFMDQRLKNNDVVRDEIEFFDIETYVLEDPPVFLESPPPSPQVNTATSVTAAAATATITTTTTTTRTRINRRRSRVRCGKCEACLHADCGTCGKCIRKKKFGGDGSCKEACTLRQCMNLKERPGQSLRVPTKVIAPKTTSHRVLQQKPTTVLAPETTSSSIANAASASYPSEDDLLDQYIIREEAKMEAAVTLLQSPSSSRSLSNRKSVLEEATTTATTAASSSADVVKEEEAPDATTRSNHRKSKGRGFARKRKAEPTVESSSSSTSSFPSLKLQKSNQRRGSRSNTNSEDERLFLYGRSAPKHSQESCAGCLGKRTEELASDPIIFCDGCDREFHLDCCMPPLEQVPAGTHYCLDCNLKGTTACLEEYFARHHEQRSNASSSRDFVLQTLQDRLIVSDEEEDADEDDDDDGSNNGAADVITRRIPQSELARASKLHHDAASFSSRFFQLKSGSPRATKGTKQHNNKSSQHKKVEIIKPNFFLGKCIRLYCPVDNQYHSGRIVDWRIATHSRLFWESEVSNIEYLVRFPAGKDSRKVAHQQWLVLEEHALAVASTLIWGMNVVRRGVMGWNPGSTWLRTSLELIPIQAYLEHKQHQIYFYSDDDNNNNNVAASSSIESGGGVGGGSHDNVKAEHKSWALASFYGEDQHEFLDLKDESVDYFSIVFGEARCQRRRLTATTNKLSNSSSDVDPRAEVTMGLAHVEWEEQERVRTWQSMKLNNPRHVRALTLGDEASLKPCLLLDRERHASLCPSLQIDFDRTYLLTTMMEKGAISKDAAASLVCELIAPSPQVMQQLHLQKT